MWEHHKTPCTALRVRDTTNIFTDLCSSDTGTTNICIYAVFLIDKCLLMHLCQIFLGMHKQHGERINGFLPLHSYST